MPGGEFKTLVKTSLKHRKSLFWDTDTNTFKNKHVNIKNYNEKTKRWMGIAHKPKRERITKKSKEKKRFWIWKIKAFMQQKSYYFNINILPEFKYDILYGIYMTLYTPHSFPCQ